jgi:hypothetical protein
MPKSKNGLSYKPNQAAMHKTALVTLTCTVFYGSNPGSIETTGKILGELKP